MYFRDQLFLDRYFQFIFGNDRVGSVHLRLLRAVECRFVRVIVNQQELSSRNLQALVEALDWGLKQQELSRNLKILHGGKIWQELSENSRNLEGLG